MIEVKVWDPVVRICHWFTVTVVLINATFLDEGSIHEALGYAVAALLVVRLVWGFVGTKYARFSTFVPTRQRLREHLSGRSLAGQSDSGSAIIGHNPLGALMIFNLLLTLVVICLTGHFMTTDRFWGSEIMEDVHEAFVTYLLVSVAIHVAGVLIESFRTRANLISAMVTGKKKLR
ncbi:MAG: cytochrome b/b6 domain-containing protein [Porticoccus sp.]